MKISVIGDVMTESARTALSHVRFHSGDYGVDPEFYKKYDIHIHAPEGAVPKDGPSAGITMATALVSALTGIPVRGDVAMTGEITLRGRVLAIGGLREKSMAAMVAGVKTVIIPEDNLPDVEQLSEAVKNSLTFIPVKRFEEVLPHALTSMPSSNCDEREEKPADGIDRSDRSSYAVPAGKRPETGTAP